MRILITACLALAAATATAGDKTSPDPHALLEQLHELHAAGEQLQRDYDDQDRDQLKACGEEAAPLRDRAKELMSQARELDITGNAKTDITLAADQAMSCLWCSNDLAACRKMDEHLTTAEKRQAELDQPDQQDEAAQTRPQPWPGKEAGT